jgi:chromosome segregation ATPase
MDLNQMSQVVTWLDEERRADRVELTKLLQRLETQEHGATSQARRIEQLEERLVRTQAQITRFGQMEERLEQVKNELALMIRGEADERKQDRRESDQLRLAERENIVRSLNELRRQFQELPRYQEELLLRRAEDQRLGEAVVNLQQEVASLGKPVETQARSVAYLEQQVGQALRQITALQDELADLLKGLEAVSVRVPALEEPIRRTERRLQELAEQFPVLAREQHEFFEKVRLGEVQRERQMVDWAAEIEAQKTHMTDFTAQIRTYRGQHEEVQRVLPTLDKFKDRTRQQLNEAAELQRIAEVRQKQEVAQWQEEADRRWRKQEVIWNHQWHEQGRANEEYAQHLELLQQTMDFLRSQTEALWKVHEEHARQRFDAVRAWQTRLQELIGEDGRNASQSPRS